MRSRARAPRTAAVGDAVIDEPRHRQDDQHAQDRRKADHDRPGEIDPHTPKYRVYRALISSLCASTAAGSSFITLIWERGLRPDFSGNPLDSDAEQLRIARLDRLGV